LNVLAIRLHNTLTVMPIYRCYFLDEDDHITDVAELETDVLDRAIDRALALLRTRPEHDAIEIWQGAERLYAGRRELR